MIRKWLLWLTVALTCLAVVVVWNSRPLRQKRAVDVISGYGASITFDTRHRHPILRRLLDWRFTARVYLINLGMHPMRGAGVTARPAIADSQLPDIVAHLQDLPELETLILAGTAITDVGAAHLDELKHVRELDLSWTGVTDACLPFLAEIDALEAVDLTKTKVSAEGLREFRELRPNIRIEEIDWKREGVTERIR